MTNIFERIQTQVESLQKKIDSLSGNYLTNTPKRQREQKDRDTKIERWLSQKQLLEYLAEASINRDLTSLEKALLVGTFYENMRWRLSQLMYAEEHPGYKPSSFSYPTEESAQKPYKKADIHNSADLEKAVAAFKELVNKATLPPDPNAIRIRDLVFEARNNQGGDIQFTPAETAQQLVSLSGIHANSKVLEPEAGIGSIADEAKKITPDVDCIEQMGSFGELLQLKGHNLIGSDLFECEPNPIYDAVMMNPPYSAECKHIKYAFDFVKPGGILVALCCSRVLFKKTKEYESFWNWLNEQDSCFREVSGKFEKTNVDSKILIIKKTA